MVEPLKRGSLGVCNPRSSGFYLTACEQGAACCVSDHTEAEVSRNSVLANTLEKSIIQKINNEATQSPHNIIHNFQAM